MKRNLIIWILFIIFSPILAGLYGILHDFITFTISPEYFTNFKFIQFQIPDYIITNKILAVTIIGISSTWWTGLPIGIILGGYGIWKKEIKFNTKLKLQSIGLTVLTTLLFGLIGGIVGKILFSTMNLSDVFLKNNSSDIEMTVALSKITDWENFIIVGTIHNFSYIGGLVGLCIGCFYQFKKIKTLQ